MIALLSTTCFDCHNNKPHSNNVAPKTKIACNCPGMQCLPASTCCGANCNCFLQLTAQWSLNELHLFHGVQAQYVVELVQRQQQSGFGIDPQFEVNSSMMVAACGSSVSSSMQLCVSSGA